MFQFKWQYRAIELNLLDESLLTDPTNGKILKKLIKGVIQRTQALETDNEAKNQIQNYRVKKGPKAPHTGTTARTWLSIFAQREARVHKVQVKEQAYKVTLSHSLVVLPKPILLNGQLEPGEQGDHAIYAVPIRDKSEQGVFEVGDGAFGSVQKPNRFLLFNPKAPKGQQLKQAMSAEVGVVEKTIRYESHDPSFTERGQILHEGNMNQLHYPQKSQGALLGKEKGHLFMDYVGDMNLLELSEKRNDGTLPLTPEAIYEIAYNLIEAVQAFHKKTDDTGVRYVILDCKPENIRVNTQTKQVFLVDFGLSREIGKNNDPLGTRPYKAPETWDEEPHAQSMDYFALPQILFKLFNPNIEEESDTYFYTLPYYEYQGYTRVIVETRYHPHGLKIEDLPQSNHATEQKEQLMEAMRALTAADPNDRPNTLDDLLEALEPLKSVPTSTNSPSL